MFVQSGQSIGIFFCISKEKNKLEWKQSIISRQAIKSLKEAHFCNTTLYICTPCQATPRHTTPRHAILHHTTLQCTTPHYTITYNYVSYYTIAYHIIPYHIIPYHSPENICYMYVVDNVINCALIFHEHCTYFFMLWGTDIQ